MKVLNPCNKKEHRVYTLRRISTDLDTPNKLKDQIIQQCGQSGSHSNNVEIGFFHHSKKVWINNRLDLNDMWQLLTKGDKVTLWYLDNGEVSNKRPRVGEEEENELPSKKTCRMDTKKAQAREFEVELKKKHESTYTPFQYKLWAEMYANGSHNSLEKPPSAAMFNREVKQSRSSHGQSDLMVSVIEKLCTALTPKQEKGGVSVSSSPVKRAELRTTYIKQLNEIKMLRENEILTQNEYDEQRDELVMLMKQLKSSETVNNQRV